MIGIAVVVFFLLAAPITWYCYRQYSVWRELEALTSDLDAVDPGWRLEEMLARRETVPDGENAALVIDTAYNLLPKGWQLIFDKLDIPSNPPQLLDEKNSRILQDGLSKCRATTDELEKLYCLTNGQCSLKWYGTVLGIDDDSGFDLFWFVRLRAILLSQNNQPLKAWNNAFLLWKIGDTSGREPCSASIGRKSAGYSATIIAIERVLAQGEVKDEVLAKTQDRLRGIDCQLLLNDHVKVKRAVLDHLYSRLEEGDPKFEKAYNEHMHSRRPKLFEFRPPSYEGRFVIPIHIAVLRFYTKAIKIFDAPPTKRYQQLSQLRKQEELFYDKYVPYGSTASYVMGEGAGSLGDSYLRLQAKLHCARVGLACERFRLKQKRWPSRLDDLVKNKLIRNVPIDPIDGKVLRYRQSKNGVIIYSIGFPDSPYDGSSIDDPEAIRSYNGEFRLWNNDRRRQLP